jgi:hypothetical protein
MTIPYSPDELRGIFRRRLLESLDIAPDHIHRLCFYAHLNRLHLDLFIEEMTQILQTSPQDHRIQLSLMYLINEIVQTERDTVPPFLPLIELLMIKAAETQDEDHIRRAKHVLTVLADREILDQQFASRLMNSMGYHAAVGADEDVSAADELARITARLVQVKQSRIQKVEQQKSQEEVETVIADEKRIRNELIDFHSKQASGQVVKTRELEKLFNPQKLEKKRLLNLFGPDSDEEDSDDQGLL